MIRLSTGANTIILTLNEAKTLVSPEYVLVLREKHNKKQVACKLGTDLSEYPDRFNKFTVTVTDDPTALDAEVSLKDLTYEYYVYEREDADAFDFASINTTDLTTLTGEVENGIAQYITTPTSHTSYISRAESVESYGD